MVDIHFDERNFEPKSRVWALVGVFTVSIFLSAFLLFSVQPMFTKLVLPLLGGSPNVWNTAMVFFQSMLLGGYIYAHLITKYLRLHWQVICHGAVLALGTLFLPLAIATGWTPPAGGTQAFWLIGLFGVSVGLPFFAISANAPLLQRWFSRTSDKDAQDPYFLYAASNAGSLISLCLYPVLFEPMLVLEQQTGLWSAGYVLLLAVIVLAGYTAWKNKVEIALAAADAAAPVAKLTFSRRAFWVFLAFIPSSLMLGVTSQMTQNIASVPFLWIMPLGLYLLTFIIVFAKTPLVTTKNLSLVFPASIVLAMLGAFIETKGIILPLGVSLFTYFIVALFCHSRLADTRPNVAHLTEFYIWMSVGGVLGGVFNALIAPVAFDNVYEYVLVLLLATLAAPRTFEASDRVKLINQYCLKYLLPALFLFWIIGFVKPNLALRLIMSGSILLFGLSQMKLTRTTFAITGVMLGSLCMVIANMYAKNIHTERSFFALLKVKHMDTDYGDAHMFGHGDTIHNFQLQAPELRKVPLAYYAEGNTFEKALSAARARKSDLNVAMIGLGAGAMACYAQPGDNWTYYEIDPTVVDIAKNPNYFSYMSECAPKADVVIGDARLTIVDLPPKSQDIIFVDAFSSDSIPMHLITTEALEVYRSRLKDNGVIFYHTSNRMMDVSSVVARMATAGGLESRYISMSDFSGHPYEDLVMASNALLVGHGEDLDVITANDPNWVTLEPSPYVTAWTDSYSSVIGAIRSRRIQKKNEPNAH